MDYAELIGLALEERSGSVNATAKALGVPLSTFQRYVKGDRFPDFDIGLRIVEAARIDAGLAFRVIANAQREYKKLNSFRQLE